MLTVLLEDTFCFISDNLKRYLNILQNEEPILSTLFILQNK